MAQYDISTKYLLLEHPKVLKEEIVQESTFFQHHLERATKRLEAETEHRTQEALEQGLEQGKAQGLEQGMRESTIESIIDVLEVRFQPSVAQALKPALERVTDLRQLRQLLRTAAQVQTLEAFTQSLMANGN